MDELEQIEEIRDIQSELEEEIERLLQDRMINGEKLTNIHSVLERALADLNSLGE